jgi:hypothetical protein
MKFLMFAMLLLCACDEITAQESKAAIKQVDVMMVTIAQDEITQYQIAKRAKDKMHMCLQAGLVAAAYMQAKDETRWNQWRATEKADCHRAGLDME